MSLNKVQLIGRVGKDPETRNFDNGGKIVNFTVATSERWKDKTTGDKKEKTEWHNISVSLKGLANVAETYIKKGMQLYIEGSLKTRSWDGNDGQKRYMTEISAINIQMLGGKNEQQQQSFQQPKQQPKQTPPPPVAEAEDLPF